MKRFGEQLIRIALLMLTLLIWLCAFYLPFARFLNLSIIVGAVLLVFPVVWVGRRMLDRTPTIRQAIWTTTYVHYAVGALFGVAIIRAVLTRQDWSGWRLPIPGVIGLSLMVISTVAVLLTVGNLALKGLGAPFAIALSRKLAADWLYAWTRNPMVLSGLICLLATGVWFQSTLFVLWTLFLVTPALLFFVKVYEERELEIRFGESYREYKARTPMLFPRKPIAGSMGRT